jgi:hypothetical protein
MKSLTNFFERYKHISPPDVEVRDSVVFLFEKHLSYPLTKEQVSVRSHVVYVRCSSVVKHELLLKKKEILSELSSLISPRIVHDIR